MAHREQDIPVHPSIIGVPERREAYGKNLLHVLCRCADCGVEEWRPVYMLRARIASGEYSGRCLACSSAANAKQRKPGDGGGRPPNLEPLPFHPALVPGEPRFMRIYGHSGPALQVKCPACQECRWIPMGTLREQLKRESFRGFCRPCFSTRTGLRPKSNKRGTGRKVGADGYVVLRLKYVSPDDESLFLAMQKNKTVLEHRWVMAKHLGRALAADENVHHMNGIRDDNRIENLELWVRHQPIGTRVEDAVRHAREILRRHDAEHSE